MWSFTPVVSKLVFPLKQTGPSNMAFLCPVRIRRGKKKKGHFTFHYINLLSYVVTIMFQVIFSNFVMPKWEIYGWLFGSFLTRMLKRVLSLLPLKFMNTVMFPLVFWIVFLLSWRFHRFREVLWRWVLRCKFCLSSQIIECRRKQVKSRWRMVMDEIVGPSHTHSFNLLWSINMLRICLGMVMNVVVIQNVKRISGPFSQVHYSPLIK